MLVARNVTRRFGPLLALDRVDFSAHPGEIVALLGENGAGKSTLTNILAGRLRPDAGSIELGGRALRAGSAAAALAAGIAAVHQSPMLFERMSWEENLALGGFGRESRAGGSAGTRAGCTVDLADTAAQAARMAAQLGFALPPPGATLEHRSMAERVRMELLRALSFNPRVLLLDEPTGLLAPSELAAFLELLRRLRGEGRIVILVTHKLAEALAVADRIVVLRRGRVVASRASGELTESELARLMIGELASAAMESRSPSTGARGAVFEINKLVVDRGRWRALDGVDLAVAAGEIVGIAGIEGNGQSELVEAIAGVRAPASGSIRAAAADADQPGRGTIGVIAENRDLDGLVLEMPLWENLLLAPALAARACGHCGWLSAGRARALCADLLHRFRIRAPGPQIPAAALSGGNRQRLCVARALESRPRVLVAHNVTRGLDLAATAEVRRMLTAFAAAGGAVILLSSDLDELNALCSRLAVLSRGRLRMVAPGERDPARLGLLMSGAA
ncbi:MAG TPA: ATP-binding cassette domain-containing protein [Candidatus Binataceae bacterium]|nr:ATP-binding cassette domain-containing protein [Candidatus Binataceae bacterium]